MRTPAGTATFSAAVAVTILLAAAAALALVFFLATPHAADPLRALPDNPWWFTYREPPREGTAAALWRIGAAIVAACIAVSAAFRAMALFRRGASPLFPFVMLFLFSLGLECLRAGTAYLYAADRSISAAVLMTRVMYWGRFVGLLALLLASLYCVDLKNRRYGVLTGIVFLVSFAMAAYIPVDRTVFLMQLTWKLGDEQGVWFVGLVIGILILGTAAGAAPAKHERRYLALAAGLALLLLSRELLFFSVNPVLLAAGLASLVGGIILCLWMGSAIDAAVREKKGV